ncbi:hypothetical protein WG29040_23440 [Pseudomonas sp. PAMC 29040]|uniref:hypothetical protein n=1 Tax=Pseudomonas sp. PAMC 29040 TaxID=2498450 RepID=UPI000FBE3A7B|nr:hypothetical protein [Pseudomonas sp. PAMC 29040]RUT30895.1 hypothetical protein WG29040_23440 [Pseudomonas sp. PAMC 29040]
MENTLKNVLLSGAAISKAYAAPAQTPELAKVPHQELTPLVQAMLDAVDPANAPAVMYTDEMRQDAVSIVHEWAESELETGEGFADRLYALIVGTASDSDEDLTEDEAEYAAMLAEQVGDYLEGKGIDSADVEALLSGDLEDNELAARIHDALLDKMPQGEDAMLDDADKFVSGDDDEMLDAVYKKVVAVRGGKKVRIKKRISGRVRLTAAQKGAVRKMQRRAFSGAAKMKRAKSMRVRHRILGK